MSEPGDDGTVPWNDPARTDPMQTAPAASQQHPQAVAPPMAAQGWEVQAAPPRRSRWPLLLALLVVVAVLALAGYLLLGKESSSKQFDRAAPAPASGAASTSAVASASSAPATGASAASASAAATSAPPSDSPRIPPLSVLPAGASLCGNDGTPNALHQRWAVGNDVTSCPFAKQVRSMYLASGGAGATGSVKVTALSPTTGKNYEMTCTGAEVVTCKGGNNAVVIIL